MGNCNSEAGANLENVCLALFTSTGLFLFGIGLNDNPIACKAMAVLLHFSWLSLYSFQSIAVLCIILKIKKTESTPENISEEMKTTRMILRLVGLGIPALFVVPLTVFAQIDLIPYFSQNQGGICFPMAFPANIIFVTEPILLSICVNTICLLLLIHHIRRNNTTSVHLSGTKSINETTVFLRFSILSGTPWLLGIFATIFKNDVFDFIFVLVCSLQSVFIVVANITTESFRRQLKVKLMKTNKNRDQNQKTKHTY